MKNSRQREQSEQIMEDSNIISAQQSATMPVSLKDWNEGDIYRVHTGGARSRRAQ